MTNLVPHAHVSDGMGYCDVCAEDLADTALDSGRDHMSVPPQIIATTEPYGFTQYIDRDGDYLTFGEVEDGTERQVYGIVAAIATPSADGMGLSAEQARDLARRLVAAANKAEEPGLG